MVDEGARRRKIGTGGGERGLILVQGVALSALWLSACFATTGKQPAITPAAFVRLRSIERRESSPKPEYCLCRGG